MPTARASNAEALQRARANLRERKKAESQLRILEAAKAIFFRDGFKDASAGRPQTLEPTAVEERRVSFRTRALSQGASAAGSFAGAAGFCAGVSPGLGTGTQGPLLVDPLRQMWPVSWSLRTRVGGPACCATAITW